MVTSYIIDGGSSQLPHRSMCASAQRSMNFLSFRSKPPFAPCTQQKLISATILYHVNSQPLFCCLNYPRALNIQCSQTSFHADLIEWRAGAGDIVVFLVWYQVRSDVSDLKRMFAYPGCLFLSHCLLLLPILLIHVLLLHFNTLENLIICFFP